MVITDEDLVRRRLALKAYLEMLAEAHKAELQPWQDQQELVEGEMLRRLNERQAKNSSTPAGTFYKEDGTSFKVTDKVAFLDFVFTLRMNADPNAYDMLTQSVAKDSVLDYRKANDGKSPPGIEATGYTKIKVRKG